MDPLHEIARIEKVRLPRSGSAAPDVDARDCPIFADDDRTSGRGRFILNALRIVENLGRNPAADRLLLNLIRQAMA